MATDRTRRVRSVRALVGRSAVLRKLRKQVERNGKRVTELAADHAVLFAALGIHPGEHVEQVPKLRTGVRLTDRQREVAELLGRGLSNRDIARRLAVAQRTAESHVSAVLEATGFATRAQVSAWVAAGGLYRLPVNARRN